jgi:hypothetical protein
MDPVTLTFRDPHLEARFWASWQRATTIGDVLDASSSALGCTLMLLNRLGQVRWDFIRGDLRWLIVGILLARLANLAWLVAARRHYLRHRFSFYAGLKLYMAAFLSPRFIFLALKQTGPHSWVVLGGRDGTVDSFTGTVRALLLPTGAYATFHECLLPPFRLPWRLMAPLHLLHGTGLVAAGYSGTVRLLGLFPRLSQDARAICQAVHGAQLLLTGMARDTGTGDPCAGANALGATALFTSLVLILVVPLVVVYAGGLAGRAGRAGDGQGAGSMVQRSCCRSRLLPAAAQLPASSQAPPPVQGRRPGGGATPGCLSWPPMPGRSPADEPQPTSLPPAPTARSRARGEAGVRAPGAAAAWAAPRGLAGLPCRGVVRLPAVRCGGRPAERAAGPDRQRAGRPQRVTVVRAGDGLLLLLLKGIMDGRNGPAQ